MRPYLELAETYGYQVKVITCTGSYGSIHSVPDETLKKMAQRWEHYEQE